VGLLGAATAGLSATLSCLLPLKKDDIGRTMMREKFISRAGSIGAHTGTSLGTLVLIVSFLALRDK
jgi:hypothetical protein